MVFETSIPSSGEWPLLGLGGGDLLLGDDDFDDLWSNLDRLSELLGFEVELPKKRSRCEKPEHNMVNENLFESLRNAKSRLKNSHSFRWSWQIKSLSRRA